MILIGELLFFKAKLASTFISLCDLCPMRIVLQYLLQPHFFILSVLGTRNPLEMGAIVYSSYEYSVRFSIGLLGFVCL